MPSHKLQRLYQLCLESIVKNANMWALKLQSGTTGPFDNLPPALAQDLLDMYENIHRVQALNTFWLEQSQWRIFLTQNITKLVVTEFTEKSSLVHISATCHNLKHLEVKNLDDPLSLFKVVASCLGTVVILDLQVSTVTNATLKFIKEHCTNLRILRLRSCYVTDKGVANLKLMPSLVEMDLRETEVTHTGICRILKYNPQLQILHHMEVVKSLYKMHIKTLKRDQNLLPTYRLQELEFSYSKKENPFMLLTIISVCPVLEKVHVEFDFRGAPFALAPLCKLESLKQLHIQCVGSKDCAVNEDDLFFNGSIIPILKTRGRKLTTLYLENVAGVDMKSVECYCPQLLDLGLFYNTYSPQGFSANQNIEPHKIFRNLKKLSFGSNIGEDDFPSFYLEALLLHEDLEELLLSGSPLYSDEMFKRVFQSNSFPKLRKLELDYCNISQQVIESFLTRSTSLAEVSICGHCVYEQASQALDFILKENLDVHLEAYIYSFMKFKKRIIRYKQYVHFIRSKHSLLSEKIIT